MYNFLGLVNDVNKRLNEVELTSANFAAATGYYADAKNYVNISLSNINNHEFEWPFNFVAQVDNLVINQTRYPFPTDAKSIAFDTFRIKGDTSLNVKTARLTVLDYEEFLDHYADQEFNPDDHADTPRMVFRCRNQEYGIVPCPDQAYELHYDYYSLPPNLENWDDVPTVPEQFKWVINEGAMSYAYTFRGDLESAAQAAQNFKEALKDMRKIYINRTEYVRSSVIRS